MNDDLAKPTTFRFATSYVDAQHGNVQHGYIITGCPGCGGNHFLRTSINPYSGKDSGVQPMWDFNGNLENPTFSPSVLRKGGILNPDGTKTHRCHFYLRGGIFEFLSDCTHHLAGQKISLLAARKQPQKKS